MNDKSYGKEMTDQELDKLLARASVPQIPPDFLLRMERRLREAASGNVVAFPSRPKLVQSSAWRWPVAAALAASLVFGFWMGGRDADPAQADPQGDMAMLANGDFSPTGMDDLDDLDLGQQS